MLDTTAWTTRTQTRPAAHSPTVAMLASLGSGRHLLDLSGRLALGWMGRLAAALADRRVNIVSARARQGAPRQWVAAFELEPVDPGLDLAALDFVSFAALQPARPPALEPRLRSYRLERTEGGLRVELRADDQLGFLDGILRTFAACGLFPDEMLVETRDGEARDAFVLRGIGGSEPPRAIREALDARLARLARRAAPGARSR
ncbi:ACT domain-containing protein [Anaeromyxobacter paludicola]|uniref:ACT domain-containing protein n=1 Tax=Anaeromyxobacter paludicola TaxID=2918171 RepID=A0ABM7XFR3_9BACT|nr:hypothetical protein [Anaeromyxobacter paludicola]BDG10718.1 hypothetical protein AMPC_38310 [Anaeromyxobacter paludicola]